MTRTTANKKKKQNGGHSHWAELIAETSFPVTALKVLEEHHAILNTFCANTYGTEIRPSATDNGGEDSANYELSFHHYCVALSMLIHHGSPAQQFEYLHHTYAAANERGIDRTELMELLKDHSERAANIIMKEDKLLTATDPRYFDKLYTWLKKHFILYDRSRCGFLPERPALEMLQSHPIALTHLKFQLTPFIKKVKENNARYSSQVASTQSSD